MQYVGELLTPHHSQTKHVSCNLSVWVRSRTITDQVEPSMHKHITTYSKCLVKLVWFLQYRNVVCIYLKTRRNLVQLIR